MELYYIEETARYEIEAKSAREAVNKFLFSEEGKIKCSFPTEVIERAVFDAHGDEQEAEE